MGRVDAVLLDNIIADRAMRREYRALHAADAGADRALRRRSLAPGNTALRDRINDILLRARCATARWSGSIRKWDVWDDDQPQLYARAGARHAAAPAAAPAAAGSRRRSRRQATLRYLPALLRAALITLVLSCLAMALAVVVRDAASRRPRLRQRARCACC